MSEVPIIGIDLAKRVFQLHGSRRDGSVVFRKRLSRGQLLAFVAELLLIRASAYRPAAVSIAATRGLIHDRTRSHAQAVQKPLEPTGASIHAQIG